MVQASAHDSSGYYFIGWALDGTFNEVDNPASITMNSNHALSAYFQATPGYLWPKYTDPTNGYVLGPTTGKWDNDIVYGGRPFTLQNGTFGMIYAGDNSNGTRAIGLALSVDGFTWTKYPKPILLHGAAGTWEGGRIGNGQVIWDGSQYVMYYTGRNAAGHDAVGRATSTDLIHWTKYSSNPVLDYGVSGEGTGPVHPSVLKVGSVYKMWYTAPHPDNGDSKFYFADSPDGIVWTRHGTPVFVHPRFQVRGIQAYFTGKP